jgi:hypothetical protein
VGKGDLSPRCRRGIFALVERRGDFPGWRRGVFPWCIFPGVEMGDFFPRWAEGNISLCGGRFCPLMGGRGFFLGWEEGDIFPRWEEEEADFFPCVGEEGFLSRWEEEGFHPRVKGGGFLSVV